MSRFSRPLYQKALKLRKGANASRLLKAEEEAQKATAWAIKRAGIAQLVRVKIANNTRLKAESAEQTALKAVAKAQKALDVAKAVGEATTPYYAMMRSRAIEAQAALEIAKATAAAKKQAAMEAAALEEELLLSQPIHLPEDEAGLQAAIVVAKQRYQEARRIAHPYRETFCSEDYEYGCYPLVRGDPFPLPTGECSL